MLSLTNELIIYHISIIALNMLQLTQRFGDVAHEMPLPLVEPVEKMINKDIRYRPTAQLFSLVRIQIYYSKLLA